MTDAPGDATAAVGGTAAPRHAAVIVLAWALVSVAVMVFALCGLRIDPEASEVAGRANLARLWPFWIASANLWCALTAVWLLLRRSGDVLSAFVGSPTRSVAVILLVAAGARLAVVLGHAPSLSDDVFRYVFDGRNLASGINPYLVLPAERLDADQPRWSGEPQVAALVNNPELHTIYLPTSQWAFAAIALTMVRDTSDPLAMARWYRTALSVVELLAIALLARALVARRRSPWWLVLYAWHPIAITEVAGSGHQEPLGLVLLVAALVLGAGRLVSWTVALAAGGLVKPVAVPVAGLLLARRPWTQWARSAAIGLVVCAAIAAPLLLADGGAPLENLRTTATRFTLKWAHFGSVYEPLLWTIERVMPGANDPQERLARTVCTALLGLAIIVVLRRRPEPWAGARGMLLAMVLLSPAAHPWYLLWALILVPMVPCAAVWLASLTLTWGYAAWGFRPGDDGGPGWGVSPWLMLAAYAPVYAALLWRRVGIRGQGSGTPGPWSLPNTSLPTTSPRSAKNGSASAS